MLLFLLAASADPASLVTKASNKLSAAQDAPRPRGFRIERDAASAAPSTKDRALAEDGARCSLIGGRVCTRKPRTWLKTDLDGPR